MTTLPKNKLNKLKKQLTGHIRAIARQIGVSHVHVTQVLNGDYENNDIIGKCIAYRDAMQKETEQLAERI